MRPTNEATEPPCAHPGVPSLVDTSVQVQEQWLEAARRAGNAMQCADLAIALARSYSRIGDLSNAMARAELALSVLEQGGSRHRLGAAHVTHAMVTFYCDRPSQALAALGRAAGFPDLGAAERAQMYDIAALALIYLVDLPTGAEVLLEKAWPHALLSGDARLIVNVAARCVGVLHDMACWADGIASHYRLGMKAEAPRGKAHYLARARHFIDEIDGRLDAVGALDQASALSQKALVVSLESSAADALPVFLQASRLAGTPRLAMAVDVNRGRAAAIEGDWLSALGHFERARSREFTQDEAARRVLAWHMSHVQEALGCHAEALRETREFEALDAKKSKLAAEWFDDAVNQRRYGPSLDIQAAREKLLGRPLPEALVRATRFIEAQLGQALTLSDVATGAMVGKRSLQSMFRKHLGVTLTDFVRERRMQRGNEHLRSGTMRVAEVADRIGYSSAANFSRDYRKRFGRTPSETLRIDRS